MRRLLAVLAACLPFAAAHAENDAFPFGEAASGKKLFDAKCAACHQRSFGDVPTAFQRDDRKAKDAPSILAWVQRCNNANGLKLGREDEEHLSAYLNETFYRYR